MDGVQHLRHKILDFIFHSFRPLLLANLLDDSKSPICDGVLLAAHALLVAENSKSSIESSRFKPGVRQNIAVPASCSTRKSAHPMSAFWAHLASKVTCH